MERKPATGADRHLGQARAALYAAAPSDFVALRARLANELKARGEKELARAVAALRKPSVAAWALNQLGRREPARLEGLYTARAAAERAQSAGDSATLRPAIAHYREQLDEIVGWVERLQMQAGGAANKVQLRGVRETLEAAAEDREGVRAALAAGQLLRTGESDEEAEIRGLPETPSRHGQVDVALAAPHRPPAEAGTAIVHATPTPAAAREKTNVVVLAAKRLRDQAEKRLSEAAAELRDAGTKEARARDALASAERALAAATATTERARSRFGAARLARERS